MRQPTPQTDTLLRQSFWCRGYKQYIAAFFLLFFNFYIRYTCLPKGKCAELNSQYEQRLSDMQKDLESHKNQVIRAQQEVSKQKEQVTIT